MRYAIIPALLAICICGVAKADEEPSAPIAGVWPTGKYVELLPTVDILHGRLAGEITRTSDGLVVAPRPKDWGRVLLPVEIHGDYELRLQFTIFASDGHKGLIVIIPVGSRRCSVVLNGWSGHITGLTKIDGQTADKNPTTLRADIFPKPRKYFATVTVQLDGDVANIHVQAAGREVIDWSGKLASVNLDGWGPTIACPQIGDDASTVVVHSAQLKLLSGKASWADAAPSRK